MGREIERKFRVRGDGWRHEVESETAMRQGYLAADADRSVRVRLESGRARLTVKGRTVGAARDEFEYEIPPADAEQMLRLCVGSLVEKTRYRVRHEGRLWEVDVFAGANAGLAIAEAELAAADEPLALPDWVGEEVTDDPRFYNASLAVQPYGSWSAAERERGEPGRPG
jgi:adenylate cyclase